MLLVGFVLATGASSSAAGQGWPPADSAVIATLRRTAPCPSDPPPSWSRPDSLLPTSSRCHLVVAALAAMAGSPDSLIRFGAQAAVCVGVHGFAFRTFPEDGSGEAYWTVEFVRPDGSVVGAYIDRATGAVRPAVFPNEFLFPVSAFCGGDA